MRRVPLLVAAIAAGLYLLGLGRAPFFDPPEGFHAQVAREMREGGDFVTPHVNGVRYFDKPPLLYWLMVGSFQPGGPTPAAARLWSALAAIGCAAVTARLGMMLGGARMGLIAGLVVAANLGVFLFGRMVKPDLLFVLLITLAYAGFAVAYGGRGRRGLALFYAALGLAALTKDVLGALGPLAVIAVFFWLTRERPLAPWAPWWGLLLLVGIPLPWFALMEARNPGFVWYTIVDNHLLNFARQRVFPDEDVPLGALEFLVVTALAFLPWSLALPWAARRVERRPENVTERLWLLLALWATVIVGFFTLSPFKLPHYALPAFPALALLAARVWDESIEAAPRSARPRALLLPVAVLFGAAALAMGGTWAGLLPVPTGALESLDVATRNLAARGQAAPATPLTPWLPLLARGTVIFGLGALGTALAAWRRAPAPGLGVALATMLAFLPAVAGEGVAQYARARAAAPLAEVLAQRLGSDDLVVHEGPLENGGSVLLRLPRPVRVVNGLQSNLAFGATFPEGRDVFWDPPRLREAWAGPRRIFLITAVRPERSVVRALPAGAVHLVAATGSRWLYSNLAERPGRGR